VAEPGVGSAAEEAARLLGAAEHWARTRAGALLAAEHLATGSPECTVCPVCQAVGALRHVRPEAVSHLLDAAASLVAALRAAVPDPAAPPPTPGVQRIDLDEDDLPDHDDEEG
jgi:hypothetical protein